MTKFVSLEEAKRMGPQDTRIKFGGRTVYLDVVCNTNEDAAAFGERVTTAAKGPKQRMSICGVKLVNDPVLAMPIWTAIGEIQGGPVSLRWNARTLFLNVWINTDEDENEVAIRMAAACAPPGGGKRPTAVTADVWETKIALDFWSQHREKLASLGLEQTAGDA